MARIDPGRVRAVLAEPSVRREDWRKLSQGGPGQLLDEIRALIGHEDPAIRRETWDALDQVVTEGNRDDFFDLLTAQIDIEQFRRLLTDADPSIRRRVWRMRLAGYRMESFVEATVALLADADFAYAWRDCVEVLRDPVPFEAVVERLAAATETALIERLWMVLGMAAGTRVPEFEATHAPTALGTCMFSWDCENLTVDRCPHLPIAVALLGSSLEEVRAQAISALAAFGPDASGMLAAVPRSDRVARRAALMLLAEFGWHRLPVADLRVLERLIRMKQRVETPQPVDITRVHGSWFAIRTTDQAAVLELLGLRDAVPATLRMGFAPWQGTEPKLTSELLDPRDRSQYRYPDVYPEVFVTPALDGWTLAFYKHDILTASPDAPVLPERQRIYPRLERLSFEFGTAHWFQQLIGGYDDGSWSQWCVAQDGDIRVHCVSSYDVRIHRSDGFDPDGPLDDLYAWLHANDPRREPHSPPVEPKDIATYLAILREHPDARYLTDEDEDDGNFESASPLQDRVFGARGASARLSLNLEALRPHTRVQGGGVLAVPADLRPRYPRRGVLPI
ncbi:hypothetical protein VMT65_10490 [Nocardia sp. CDC153]|uniref:hypothetical protein n=1 Tax=Nocardia sp. CDC153 TaxID=3112167 RepID=UPI002DB594EE|nr:hypothetical protein [Nocardia sp. CDC153]MEC3953460.1 hypothetical protein [Nocardia sp. CDC153]